MKVDLCYYQFYNLLFKYYVQCVFLRQNSIAITGIKSNCILQYAQNVLNILKKSNISPEQSRLASQLALHLQSPSASQIPRSLQSLSVVHLKPEEN